MKLDERELATVLAALRHWQREITTKQRVESYPEHFAEVTPLADEEIDGLCEALNTAPTKEVKCTCKFCHKKINPDLAHRHDGEYVGDECCWDEKLRSSE